jgi:hypothetical protein
MMKFYSLKKAVIGSTAFLLLFITQSYAEPIKYPTNSDYSNGYESTVLIQTASQAIVTTQKDSSQIIILKHIHPLMGYTMGLNNDHKFGAFIADSAPDSWNMCNHLKDRLQLWRPDERNALLIYEKGPLNGDKAMYQRNSPLFVANGPDTIAEFITQDVKGSIPLLIHQAVYDKTNKTYSFALEEGGPADGVYDNVMLLTECKGNGYYT